MSAPTPDSTDTQANSPPHSSPNMSGGPAPDPTPQPDTAGDSNSMPNDDSSNPTPQPPQIYPIMNASAHPERMVACLISAYDPNGNALEYTLTGAPATATINPATGQFNWMPTWNDLGAYPVTVRVTDIQGEWSEATFIVHVTNQAPEMGVLMDREGHPERSIDFGVFAYDPDGDPLTYEMIKGPADASLDPTTGQFDWTPDWGQLGAHIVTIRVSDPSGASDSDSCVIMVNNQTPIMDPIMDQQTTVGMQVEVYVNAMDPDGDTLTYIMIKGPADASVDPDTGMFIWTPTSGSIGAHIVTIRCRDPGGAADQKSFVIQVA